VLSESLDEALRAIVSARVELAEREIDLVVRARSQGASWQQIGESLGLSKQAVRKRHLAVDPKRAQNANNPPTIAEYHEEMMRVLRARRRESAA
jgi:hypothetical protein